MLNDSLKLETTNYVLGTETLSSLVTFVKLWTSQYPGMSALFLLAVMLGLTRLSSSVLGQSRKSGDDASSTIPLIPYWLPLLGHIPSIALMPEKFLRGCRDESAHGVYALNFFGTTHNIVWTPPIMQTIFSQKTDVVSMPESIVWFFINIIGGIHKRHCELYKKITEPLHEPIGAQLLREPALSKMLSVAVRNFEDAIPNLVSLTAEPGRQTVWERRARAKLVRGADGKPAVEADLLSLVADFVALQAIPSVFGTDLFRNYPNLLSDLWDFNAAFLLFGFSLPTWLPIPLLRRGHAGRAAVNQALAEQQRALDRHFNGQDPGEEWRNIPNVSDLIKARNKVYRENDVPLDARSDLSILWSLNANSNFVVFWMLLRIFAAGGGLVDELRAEIAPYVSLPSDTGDSKTMRIDEKGLATSCPRLKACFIETLRVDSAPGSLRKVHKDFIVADTSSAGGSPHGKETPPQRYVLREGTFVTVLCDLHFTNPTYFTNPFEWTPQRHLLPSSGAESRALKDEKQTQQLVAEWGAVRPYGGGPTMCKGRLYAEKEVLAAVAGILAVWDFEPVGDQGWRIPRHGKTPAVYYPKDNVRIRISRREDALGS